MIDHGIVADPRFQLALCGCQQMVVARSCKTITFSNLNFTRAYSPMIALNQKMSFYGVPPPLIFPMEPIDIRKRKQMEQIISYQAAMLQRSVKQKS